MIFCNKSVFSESHECHFYCAIHDKIVNNKRAFLTAIEHHKIIKRNKMTDAVKSLSVERHHGVGCIPQQDATILVVVGRTLEEVRV